MSYKDIARITPEDKARTRVVVELSGVDQAAPSTAARNMMASAMTEKVESWLEDRPFDDAAVTADAVGYIAANARGVVRERALSILAVSYSVPEYFVRGPDDA